MVISRHSTLHTNNLTGRKCSRMDLLKMRLGRREDLPPSLRRTLAFAVSGQLRDMLKDMQDDWVDIVIPREDVVVIFHPEGDLSVLWSGREKKKTWTVPVNDGSDTIYDPTVHDVDCVTVNDISQVITVYFISMNRYEGSKESLIESFDFIGTSIKRVGIRVRA